MFKGYIASKSRGKGSFKWASGLSYSGEFKEDKREGYGKLSWPDGSSYEGYFHNDVREGHGKHTWGASREVRFLIRGTDYYILVRFMHTGLAS